MTTDWDWPGSRWWRFDLHAHTPASYDFGKGRSEGSVSWDAWVGAARSAGLDAIAVTDHNTAEGISHIHDAAQRAGGALVVFPGVELTAADGVHLLFIFGPDAKQAHVDDLLSKAGISVDRRGREDARSTMSVEQLLLELRSEAPFLAIGAHVNGPKGLIERGGLQRINALKTPRLSGVEVDPDLDCDHTFLDGKPEVGRRVSKIWASDSHTVADLGSRFTWIKMSRPNLDGLRLALLDGDESLRPERAAPTKDQNHHALCALESITVSKAKFMGRKDPFTVRLNPWMNAVIGGRGTGKSTLVDLARHALRREGELHGELRDALDRRISVPSSRKEEGLLTTETTVEIVYRKDGQRFAIGWDANGSQQPIARIEGERRSPEDGDVEERFPVRIYSQKQLFELARDPNALIGVIDDGTRGRANELKRHQDEAASAYLSLRAEARALRAQGGALPTRRVELDDVRRKVDLLQQGGHEAILKEYRWRRRMEASWASSRSAVAEGLQVLREALDVLSIPDLEGAAPEAADQPRDALVSAHSAVREILDDLRARLVMGIDEAQSKLTNVTSGKALELWRSALQKSEERYKQVGLELSDAGIATPDEYGHLLQRAATLEQEIRVLEQRQSEADQREAEALERLRRYRALRTELTESRRAFVARASGELIKIEVLVTAERRTLEIWLRESVGIARFDTDHDRLVGRIAGATDASPAWSYDTLDAVVSELRAFMGGASDAFSASDQRFAAALRKAPPERIDRLALYTPDDTVEVSFRDARDGKQWRNLSQGSPGQQTAALLAFVLGSGDEPMILDQPEDDLDNTIIYELLVRKLRESKPRRQIVVVTHSSNIVVHGDAELVVSLTAERGQTRTSVVGGLQEQNVRDEICRVMEGGREAFDSRYHRIMPASGNKHG